MPPSTNPEETRVGANGNDEGHACGGTPPRRLHGAVGDGGDPPGFQRADEDGALRREEGRLQGRPGLVILVDVSCSKCGWFKLNRQFLKILTIVAGTGAGYHLLRLLKCFYLSRFPQNPCWKSRALAWACFLLDKGWTYVFFGSTIAALQACVVALNGVDALQWSKLCNIYTRFCDQVAAAILSCLLASAAMAVLSAFSARDLFRLYSSAIAGSAPSCNSE